ncbi:hypothetical protein [Spongiimicrobium salis]|uniref:hypothetical protein n=1 Tax=Spongiimicrobium salis TaxID=1667022 RepID=UPI00374CD85D
MKNKIILVILLICILQLISCQPSKDFYPKDSISIIGLFRLENVNYLVFSTPPESLFYCSGLKDKENSSIEGNSFFFIRSKTNESIDEKLVDYKSEHIKNNLSLSENLDLDPYFYYVEIEKTFETLEICDTESSREVLVEIVNVGNTPE